VYFEQNSGRLARDANGRPTGWTNFEIKMHKSVEGRLYLFSFSSTVLIDITPNHMVHRIFSGATLHDITRQIHNNTINLSIYLCRSVEKVSSFSFCLFCRNETIQQIK
jgi:hypothetical protein